MDSNSNIIDIKRAESYAFASRIRKMTAKGITLTSAPELASLMGAQPVEDGVRFMVWYPGIQENEKLFLELFVPQSDLVYDKPEQHGNMTYYRFEMIITEDFGSVILSGVPVGNRNQFGAFYRFLLSAKNGVERTFGDLMAWSLPYGIHAPAEVYDAKSVLASRKDGAYYSNLASEFSEKKGKRISPAANILEVHTSTATQDGTLHSLSTRFKRIGDAYGRGSELRADDKNLSGFQAIELMPVHPVVEHTHQHKFWSTIQNPKQNGSDVTVRLRKPDTTNWGYDTVFYGGAAINASILATGRPHELLDLIETLHQFPEQPVKVVLDVVYGHAHEDAAEVLPSIFFSGPNKYGLNLNLKHPLVRNLVLEMLRRVVTWGVDGLRIDASHDFRYYDAEEDEMLYDNDMIRQIANLEAEAGGIRYKPWIIFEDSRPWPRNDWIISATYRDLSETHKHAFQWSPLIFSHNRPFEYTYWLSRWWRIEESLHRGRQWITGVGNHDTLRRGAQLKPETVHENDLLGNSLKMVIRNAYNNPAATLLVNGFLPGVPMDFLQALGNAPWTFFRNTDSVNAIDLLAAEANFANWQITDVDYRNSRFFKRLKEFGFRDLSELRQFLKAIASYMGTSSGNLELISELLIKTGPKIDNEHWTPKKLNEFASAWMHDIHHYCNVDMHSDFLDKRKAEFNLQSRRYRMSNSWLASNLFKSDFLKYRKPVQGAVILYGYRRNPETGKEIILIVNLEGQSRQVVPTELDLPIESPKEWTAALSTPSVRARVIDQPIRLSISQGILFQR